MSNIPKQKGPGADETGTSPAKPTRNEIRTSGTYEREHPPPRGAPSGSTALTVPCPSIEDLIEEHEEYVATIIASKHMRDEGEEIAQEVFVEVFKLLRGKSLPGNVKGLIGTITLRRIADHQRARVRERARESEVDADDLMPQSQPDLDDLVDAKRASEAVFAEMPEDEVAMLRTYDFDGPRPEGPLTSTVRAQLTRIRAKFTAILDRIYQSPREGDR